MIVVVEFALASILILAPWIFGFTSAAIPSANAVISGAVLGLASISAIVILAEWPEWVSLVVGLWVAISPWVVGYDATAVSAMRTNALIGIGVVLLVAAEIALTRRTPPRVRA
ncbi:MAG TPA: SPW repeat protein [Pseudolabrys sp.]|nr:SPW repeat protein [Pseudolabrys sp.]